MQAFIMLFAAGQFFAELKSKVRTERQELSIRQQVRDEIYLYRDLKNAWGLGHIRIQIMKKRCGCICHHIKIIGHYRDYYELTKQNIYLGRSYSHAKSRLNHVKSFL